MKKYLLSTATVFLICASAAKAQPLQQDDSMYASILGGWTFDPGLMAGGIRNDMHTGYNVGARFGYGLDNLLPMPSWSIEADTF